MEDRLMKRTRLLMTDYLVFCARQPGDPKPLPTSDEAAVLRSVAAEIRQRHEVFFSSFLGYPGNRLELVTQMADAVLCDSQSFNWDRLVVLLVFAGTLLTPVPSKAVRQRNEQNHRKQVARDCFLIVDLLCGQLLEQHRAWLEDQDGWDGFCRYFKGPLPLSFWRRLLIQVFLSCFFGAAILYVWKRL